MAKKVGVHGTDAEVGRKTECPISKEAFLKDAKPIKARLQLCDELGNPTQEAISVCFVKEFSTGSFGWHGNDKITLEIGGVPVKIQANILLSVVGSKVKV